MPEINPNDFPGYLEAIEQENLVRDAAFLDVTESIGPFEVAPLTLRKWIILRLIKSPFIYRGVPLPEQLAQFLWVLQPNWNPQAKDKKQFLKKCRNVFMPPQAWFLTKKGHDKWTSKVAARLVEAEKIIIASQKYIEEAFMDFSMTSRQGFQESYFSDAAFFCYVLGSSMGLSERDVLDMPLKRIAQYLRCNRKLERDQPLGNRSEAVLNDLLGQRN